jgi:hypothetical protein
MKRTYLVIALLLGLAVVMPACVPAAAPTQDQFNATQAAQTIEKLMTQVIKQTTPIVLPTATITATLPATETASPSPTVSPTSGLMPGQPTLTKTAVPSLTRTLSDRCLSSFFVGVIGAKWDTERLAWVLDELSNVPFTATFDVRNNGSCTWDPSFRLIYYTGEHMSGPDYVIIGSSVIPNDSKFNHVNIDVGPLMIGGKGYHTGYWAMQTSDGRTFGPSFLITILIK